jgi:hypothetical protein
LRASPPSYRDWIADLVGRRNAQRDKLVGIERARLQALPPRRTTDHDEASVVVTASSGFALRKVFYTVPSRLIGYRLKRPPQMLMSGHVIRAIQFNIKKSRRRDDLRREVPLEKVSYR